MKKSELRRIIKEEYNELQLMRLHPGYSKDPDKEIDVSEKSSYKLEKKLKPLVDSYLYDQRNMLEMFEQQVDMGDKSNETYIKPQKEWVKELENILFKLEKGVW